MKIKKPVKTTLLLILFAVCLNAAVNHLDVVGKALSHFFGLLSPILFGFILAFLLSIPVNALEKHIINPMERDWLFSCPCSVIRNAKRKALARSSGNEKQGLLNQAYNVIINYPFDYGYILNMNEGFHE